MALFPEDREGPELDCEVVQVRLVELTLHAPRRDTLMLKLGAANKDAGRAGFRVEVDVPHTDEERAAHGFIYRLCRKKLREVFRREGRYLLRSHMTGEDPAELWRHSMRLTEIEQAFKELKHTLAIRPIFHPLEPRIEAHIFVSFIAYCLLVTLKNLARPHAPSSRSSPSSRGSSSMCRPPTGATWCWRAIPGRARTTNGSCASST